MRSPQRPVKLDETYTTPDQTHAMMEPHATIAAWNGDKLTCWCPIQQLNWGRRDLGKIVGIPRKRISVMVTPFIGGSFGGKGTVSGGHGGGRTQRARRGSTGQGGADATTHDE